MKIGRRIFLGTLAAGAALGGYWANRRFRLLHDQIAQLFGPEVAADPATDAFVRDYLVQNLSAPEDAHPSILTRAFLQSTDFLEKQGSGEPLSYDGLYDAYSMPCANRLSADWEPSSDV